MSAVKFDVALEVSRLKSDPAKAANLANLTGVGGNFSNFSNFSRGAPPVGPSSRTDLDAPAPDIRHGGPVAPARPSREACQARGCAMWLSGGPDDPACSWRCIGSMAHGGESVEAAHKPRLADLDACPFGQLGGTGLDDWPPFPPSGVDFPAYEAAGSLLDLCRRHGLRVEITGGKARVIYPAAAPPALVEYAELLLAEGRSYILNMKNQMAEGPEVSQ